ncbi:MAG TPA: DUF4349 domain-containing protein [Acidimicrobiia bacterium]|nr:DUF4349 domain-containing protein [Acidimicrobiia bacterium]
MRRTLVAIGILGLILSACGGDGATETFSEIGSGLDGGESPYFQSADTEEPARDSDDGIGTGENLEFEIALSADRKVIRNVALQLASDDTRAAYEKIIEIAEQNGGFVAGAEVLPSGVEEQPYVSVTVRVPSANLSAALAGFKEAADEVLSESQDADDVTENFIDLEAQLANLTLLEAELRSLLEEVREQPDADPEKLLRVFTEISNTRGQIEQIQGQLNYLSDAVDLATVSMTVEPTSAAVPIVEAGWTPIETVREAARNLVSGLQNLIDIAITFVIGTLPMLLIVVGIPGSVLFLAYRSWRARRPTTAGPLPSE